MLAEALEHLVQGIVSHPNDVRIRDRQLRRLRLFEVRVNREDIGKVIGRNGRTATALRTVLKSLAGREQIRIEFSDGETHRKRRG